MTEEKRPLATLPVASTSFRREAEFGAPGGQVELTYEFQRDGVWVHGGLRFEGACAYRHRGESRCTPWHVEGAYDTLIEVVQSDWVAELDSAFDTYQAGMPQRELHHYMIYVDGAGSFEVAASKWSWLPEQPAE